MLTDKTIVPIAYLYHDASVPEDAHPWLHSTMLVMAHERRPQIAGETALVTVAQAEAMVAAERERCAKVVDEHARPTYNCSSENADIYRAQADWAEAIAKSIRQLR